MILKINYQGQEFKVVAGSDAFVDALNELFLNPNYCLTYDANNQTVAFGVDLLRASVITIEPNVQSPVNEEGKATLEQYAAGRACYDKIIGLTMYLINLVSQDENHAGTFIGAFNPDVERLSNMGVISEDTLGMVRGIKGVFFETSEDNYDITVSNALSVVESCPSTETALNNAIEDWQRQH